MAALKPTMRTTLNTGILFTQQIFTITMRLLILIYIKMTNIRD